MTFGNAQESETNWASSPQFLARRPAGPAKLIVRPSRTDPVSQLRGVGRRNPADPLSPTEFGAKVRAREATQEDVWRTYRLELEHSHSKATPSSASLDAAGWVIAPPVSPYRARVTGPVATDSPTTMATRIRISLAGFDISGDLLLKNKGKILFERAGSAMVVTEILGMFLRPAEGSTGTIDPIGT